MAEYVTVTVAAMRLGVDRRTVQRWVREGEIVGHKTPGGHWRVDVESASSDLTLAQYATVMQVHHLTARRWCAQGKVPGARRTAGGHWRVPAAAVSGAGTVSS